MIHLIIKGTVDEAIAAATQRGIELASCVPASDRDCVARVEWSREAVLAVIEWYNELGLGPYPRGTLLWYRS